MGGIYEFLERKKMQNLQELEVSANKATEAAADENVPTQNKLSYEARKELNKAIKKQEKLIAESEKKIEELETSIADLEAKLATPEGASDTTLYTQYADLKKALSETMDLWTEQTMELEEMQQN